MMMTWPERSGRSREDVVCEDCESHVQCDRVYPIVCYLEHACALRFEFQFATLNNHETEVPLSIMCHRGPVVRRPGECEVV